MITTSCDARRDECPPPALSGQSSKKSASRRPHTYRDREGRDSPAHAAGCRHWMLATSFSQISAGPSVARLCADPPGPPDGKRVDTTSLVTTEDQVFPPLHRRRSAPC